VWLRPANLVRQIDGVVAGQCKFFRCDYPDPGELARQLWDLPGWAGTARRLDTELGGTIGLPEGSCSSSKWSGTFAWTRIYRPNGCRTTGRASRCASGTRDSETSSPSG
jgi:hypothetical protein